MNAEKQNDICTNGTNADRGDREHHIVLGREVIRNEARALEEAAQSISHDFADAVEMMAAVRGQIVTCGIGKSGNVAAKIASMLSSTGTPASFLNSGEAVHGDIGGMRKGDLVLAVSHSGESPEMVALLPVFKKLDLPIIAITDNGRSTLALVASIVLMAGGTAAADPISLAPTASSVAALAIGDALALALAQHRGYTLKDFEHRIGGALGRLMESVYSKHDGQG
jgi:arabinose-5-phosphate isomerase